MTTTAHAPPPNAGGRLESWLAPQPEPLTFAEAVARSVAHSALTGQPVEFVTDGSATSHAAAQAVECAQARAWWLDRGPVERATATKPGPGCSCPLTPRV